jgi:hypothetical protein
MHQVPDNQKFKVYKLTEDNVYRKVERTDIELQFEEYAKKNPNHEFGDFEVKYNLGKSNNIEFEFRKANTSNQNKTGFSIYNTGSPASKFEISSKYKENIETINKIQKALIKFVEENGRLPNKDLKLIKKDDDYLVEEKKEDSGVEKDLNDISIFENSITYKISTDTKDLLNKIAIKKALKILYEENPNLDTKEAIIEVDSNGKYVARELTKEEKEEMQNGTLLHNLYGKNSFHAIISLETQQRIKTIVALKTLYKDYPSEDISKAIIEVGSDGSYVARKLTNEEKGMNKDDLENSLNNPSFYVNNIRQETKDKINEEIKREAEEKAEKEAKERAENFSMNIQLINSFFNPSGEVTQETLRENTEDRIKELLTKVLTEDTETIEGEEDFNQTLKAYFIEMVKADSKKSKTSEEPSKMVKLIEIFNEDEKMPEELIKQEIQKAKNEEFLLSLVRLHIKENYSQLPITIDLTSSSQQDKNAFRELLESKNKSIGADYTCERINKFKIYKSNKTSDFFVIYKNENDYIFVFDKKDIFDKALTSHIDMKDKEIKENLRLITSYFESPNGESLKTKVSDLLKKEFEIMTYNYDFKSIYGDKFKEQAELEGYEYKTEALALYDDCKFDLIHKYFNTRKDDSPLLTAKLVFKLLKNGHHEYLEKFQELLKKEGEDSDAYKEASSLLKKSREASIDDFFEGKIDNTSPIIKEISADPELMEYFTKKLDACSKKIDVLTNSYKNSSTTNEDKKIILTEIAVLSSIKNPAEKILEKIAKTTRLVGDVIDSISPSGSQATEDSDLVTKSSTTPIGSAEEESNVHAIKVFLSQLKSAIEKEKVEVSEEQAVKNIKNAFFASFPPDNPDNPDPSRDFKIKFFNSLVNLLKNPEFTSAHTFVNFNPKGPRNEELFSLFSETFNKKTMESLETFKNSVKTIDDIKSAKTFFEAKKGESAEIWDESQKLVYSAIFSSLFKLSKDRLEMTSASVSTTHPSAAALENTTSQPTH